ncbi:phosphate acetyltransferase [Ruegeria sediminis]|uniref:Phosphate acetyltransferase n=1 Tax=Ruegeria sediminis TaxID=2583820 RepID=A0ABY2WVL9_9RHOB|nr:phosphate acyltransferase [Ruegeria sediminis]TMV06808.1 phosphate acetyltransferase [Ruegeria sediminis]
MTRPAFPFLSPTVPTVSEALLQQARALPTPRVALVNAGSPTALMGIQEAAASGLADPVLIGDPDKIRATAESIGFDIGGIRLVDAPHAAAAHEAARLARAGEVDAIMKGQIHSSTFLKGLLPAAAGLRDPDTRCAHVFHVTATGSDRPLFVTDAALNVDPSIETRKASLIHAIRLAQKLGIPRPNAAILSPSEDPTPSIQNTMDAAEISEWAKSAIPDAEVAGPLALDLIFSKEAAAIKGVETPVAGDADIILTPNITTGNAVVKLMVLGMGCCAGGLVLGAKVPILLTSRSQGSAARLASAALGAIAASGETS